MVFGDIHFPSRAVSLDAFEKCNILAVWRGADSGDGTAVAVWHSRLTLEQGENVERVSKWQWEQFPLNDLHFNLKACWDFKTLINTNQSARSISKNAHFLSEFNAVEVISGSHMTICLSCLCSGGAMWRDAAAASILNWALYFKSGSCVGRTEELQHWCLRSRPIRS